MEVRIHTLQTVNDLPFGASVEDGEACLGPADQRMFNYTGELEVRHGETIYRFEEDRFVEATFPAQGPFACQFVIDGVHVLDVYQWLGSFNHVDAAKFRISLAHGLAYDHRFADRGSVTIFEAGRWDALING